MKTEQKKWTCLAETLSSNENENKNIFLRLSTFNINQIRTFLLHAVELLLTLHFAVVCVREMERERDAKQKKKRSEMKWRKKTEQSVL